MREGGGNLERADESTACGNGRRFTRNVLALENNASRGGRQELGDQVEYRRLACTIRSDQRVDRAALHLKIDIGNRGKTLELLGQTARLQNEITHCFS